MHLAAEAIAVGRAHGYVVEQGRAVNVPTPFNEAIVKLFHQHGVGRMTPDPKNLEPLLVMLS